MDPFVMAAVLLLLGLLGALLIRRLPARGQLAVFLSAVPLLGVGAAFVFC